METQEVLPQEAQKKAQVVIDKIKELTFKLQHQNRLRFGKLFKELQDIYSKHGSGCFDQTIASLGFPKTTAWRWIGEYERSLIVPSGTNEDAVNWRWNIPDFWTFRRATGCAGQYPKRGTQIGNFIVSYGIAAGWNEDAHCRPPIVPYIQRLDPTSPKYIEDGEELFAATLAAHPPKPTEYDKAEARVAKFVARTCKLFKDDLEDFERAVYLVRQRMIGAVPEQEAEESVLQDTVVPNQEPQAA
jgi:hypothetical protein